MSARIHPPTEQEDGQSIAKNCKVLGVRSILYYEMHQLRQQPYQDLVAAAKAGDGKAFEGAGPAVPSRHLCAMPRPDGGLRCGGGSHTRGYPACLFATPHSS